DDVRIKWRNCARPDQPAVVVVKLREDRQDARDTDAVRTHRHGHELAVLVEHLQAERLGVLRAELEYMPDLHAALERQRARAVWGRVTVAHIRNIGDAVTDEV